MTEFEAHQIARTFMARRPDLPARSLDEWLATNHSKLTLAERTAGQTILDLFDLLDNPPAVSPEHYDGRLHRIPVERGAEFWLLADAYKAEGFTMRVRPGMLEVCKVMPGAPIPAPS